MFDFGKRTVRILSIDGGGVRGLIPCLLLEEIERRLRSRGNSKPLHTIFDLIAGTSAGGIIALAMSLPRPNREGTSPGTAALETTQISALFSEVGLEIFPRGRFSHLKSIIQAFGDKYSADALEAVAEDVFKDVTVADALTNVVVTSFDAERREPHLFKSYQKDADEIVPNFYMRDAIRATTAAPTFFAPARIQAVPPDGKSFCLVDGGIFANNPAMIAYFEARKLFPGAKRYVILSLGTGRTRRHFSYDTMKSWGYIEWVNPANGVPIYSMSSDGQSRAVLHQLEHIPEVRLFRLNGELNERSTESLDDVSSENLAGLAEVADEIIDRNQDALSEIVDLLVG